MIVSKVQKWGNSQGLRLSRQILALADIAVGDEVEIVVGEHQLTVRKVERPRYDLAELVRQIPKDYESREESFGPPVGREEW